jgi:UDP-glucose 4-epimerase
MNKQILVTGGAGYIGSHVVKELLASGHKNIIVIDDLSAGYASRVPEGVTLVMGDFTDEKLLKEYFVQGIDTVMHFAASKIAPESVTDPLKYYDNNLSKGILFLDICKKYKVKHFVFSSTAAVYGDVQGSPITEDFPVCPTNPYGWSKLMFEQVLEDSSRAYGFNHVSFRYFNAGGADPDGTLGNNHSKGEDVVSVLIRSAKLVTPFTIMGTDYDTKDGTCIRDMVHVSDLASAHVLAVDYLRKDGPSQVINLGSETGFSVREMTHVTKRVTGTDFDTIDGPRRSGDIVVSIASSEKARNILGWKKVYSDMETILTTAWQWENCSKSDDERVVINEGKSFE